jgi:hypothetical protein
VNLEADKRNDAQIGRKEIESLKIPTFHAIRPTPAQCPLTRLQNQTTLRKITC